MARGGIYRTDVEKARNALRAQGKHASIDAVRVALGNTGSKTTISRYLKELEAEEGDLSEGALSDPLADLVGRLAARLREEADERIAVARAEFDAQRRLQTTANEQLQRERDTLLEEHTRTKAALQAEQGVHETCRTALVEALARERQLDERIRGLSARLDDRESHARSLEEKHQHAREALEHFRTAVREQRELEQRRHEQQVQELQVTVRHVNEALTAKNTELLQLNRDNVRLVERNTHAERSERQLQGDLRDSQRERDDLRRRAADVDVAQARAATAIALTDTLRQEIADLSAALEREREARHRSDAAAAHAAGRVDALDRLWGIKQAVEMPSADQPMVQPPTDNGP